MQFFRVPTGTFYPPQVSPALKNQDGDPASTAIDRDNHTSDSHGKIGDLKLEILTGYNMTRLQELSDFGDSSEIDWRASKNRHPRGDIRRLLAISLYQSGSARSENMGTGRHFARREERRRKPEKNPSARLLAPVSPSWF